jgi:glycosyltransferase involved in cell wall biosynthesis
LVLWPGADLEAFYPRPRNDDFLASLGVARDSLVFSYTGNVHTANARDVRSLYVAAAILDREGTPAVLLRTGRDFCDFLGPDQSWARKVSIDLGHVDYSEIPDILSLADVLVQPGRDNEFNECRLPGKLPEFFAMGRPVILPHTNVGRFVRHGEEAWVLPKADALSIVDAVRSFSGADGLPERLAKGALEFCRSHFDWATNAAKLEEFYCQVMARTEPQPHAKAAKISA